MTASDPVASFLASVGWSAVDASPMAEDASARRYLRLSREDGASAILMTAPVATAADRTSLEAFRRIAAHLRGIGLSAPRELAAAPQAGLLLLEDFGELHLSDLLLEDASRAQQAYGLATDVTLRLSRATVPGWIERPPAKSQAGMVQLTLDLIGDPPGESRQLLPALADAIQSHASGPTVLALRDYHADNLMWLAGRSGLARIGLLDFQDAVALPLGYDLASLVDDPRRVVPGSWRQALITRFASGAGLAQDEAFERIDVLSVLRNLRILGIFHRLATEGGRDAYRGFLPRTVALIERAVANPALRDLRAPVAALLSATSHWLPEHAR